MKNLLLNIFILLSSSAIAQKNSFQPTGVFNKALAEEMLQPGNASIVGVAYTRQFTDSKRQDAPEGTLVTLYPLTPYFEEFLKLRTRKEDKNTAVYLSEEAYKYRVETKTDAYGRFIFENLKPGKYYIESVIPYIGTAEYSKQTGTTTTYNGYGVAISTDPYYEKFTYDFDAASRESKVVEVKKAGQSLNVKLYKAKISLRNLIK